MTVTAKPKLLAVRLTAQSQVTALLSVNANKNYAVVSNGKNLTGPLYLTVFKGEDGSVIDTVDYDPQITGKTSKAVKKWGISSWGRYIRKPFRKIPCRRCIS